MWVCAHTHTYTPRGGGEGGAAQHGFPKRLEIQKFRYGFDRLLFFCMELQNNHIQTNSVLMTILPNDFFYGFNTHSYQELRLAWEWF